MKIIKNQIEHLIGEALRQEFPDKVGSEIPIDYPTEAIHGDYACPIALKLGGNPRENAQKLLAAIQKPDWLEKIEIAGPGFLNFYLAPQFLNDFLREIIQAGEHFGESDVFAGKTVVTDSSHPNVAKPMGIHHILSTIIGNSLNRIFAAAGYKVVRDNYLGDWGTQFGKLIYAYREWGDEAAVKKDPIPELLKLYVKFHDEAEKDPSLEDRGRAEFKKLEEGDAENRELWQWVVDLSKAEFEKIWRRLDVEFDVIHGESFYEDKMQPIIEEGIAKGVFVEGERGALIAPLQDESMPPAIIRKADGATLYATRDLARIKYWEDTWHPDVMVNVVDVAQELYFRQLVEVAQMLGITDARNEHVQFGRMSFPEKKMSTRKGNIILLEEVIDEAVERARAIVEEKNPNLSDAQKTAVAEAVGIGALKYAVLSQNRTTNVTFTWDKVLALDGNSAPYLQYAHARASSILRKAEEEDAGFADTGAGQLQEAASLNLARLLPKFPEVVARAAEFFAPNYIATYLFDVARAFSAFYAEVPVLQAEEPERTARLNLVKATKIVLANGLGLLGGVQAPEEM